ncbi:MAG: hypothetical protein ACFBSD_10670 [Paracoccaceae bacterium]
MDTPNLVRFHPNQTAFGIWEQDRIYKVERDLVSWLGLVTRWKDARRVFYVRKEHFVDVPAPLAERAFVPGAEVVFLDSTEAGFLVGDRRTVLERNPVTRVVRFAEGGSAREWDLYPAPASDADLVDAEIRAEIVASLTARIAALSEERARIEREIGTLKDRLGVLDRAA